MICNIIKAKEELFYKLGSEVISHLQENEHLTIDLNGEESLFARINTSKIRQITKVEQGTINLKFISGDKSINYVISFTADYDVDLKATLETLIKCRADCSLLPVDPFIIYPENNGISSENYSGEIPDDIIDLVLTPVKDIDFTGLLTSGYVFRGNINSKGQKHWFSTESFYIDFSIYSAKQHAVKGIYADTKWNNDIYLAKVNEAKYLLKIMQMSEKTLDTGSYRTYFAPHAVAEILGMFSWNAVNMSALKQGNSALLDLSEKNKLLSEKFSLSEDFTLKQVPRFNNLGEVSNEVIPLIVSGKLENLLTSSKTAKEYNLTSNNANSSESLRSPTIAAGDITKDEILKRLGTGIFVSNLHYLNWSDLHHGRITGMTRYACFWVENGKIICPIKNMRFDETLYNFFGENLEGFTNFKEIIPNTCTYEQRGIGASAVPGMLVKGFTYTL